MNKAEAVTPTLEEPTTEGLLRAVVQAWEDGAIAATELPGLDALDAAKAYVAALSATPAEGGPE